MANFFNEMEIAQTQRLVNCMAKYSNVELAPNQRVKTDKNTGITWLEEKQRFTTCDGQRHNCWVRIGIVEK